MKCTKYKSLTHTSGIHWNDVKCLNESCLGIQNKYMISTTNPLMDETFNCGHMCTFQYTTVTVFMIELDLATNITDSQFYNGVDNKTAPSSLDARRRLVALSPY